MKSTKIERIIQRKLEKIISKYQPTRQIVQMICKSGGRTLLVGGAVRDLFLKLPVKDLDIEVHGISLVKLERILKKNGPVSLMGRSFGVLRLHGLDIDWSLPRLDMPGRKPKVTIDPAMSLKNAFQRRDLTINAMGIDLLTFELIDLFNGYKHLKNKILHAVDKEKFVEDPLRFYRVMQFVGRFEMTPDKKLNDICKKMDLTKISTERIETEFVKLMLKSKRPSLGIRWIQHIGRLHDTLPELASIVGVPQHVGWHPEGEVFEHTMQSIDAAAALRYENDYQKLITLHAMLCHDLGKASTTEKTEGVWKSRRHEQQGLMFSRRLLKRITKNKELVGAVQKLVRYHMLPAQFVAAKSSPAAYKRLARKLAPNVSLQLLAQVALADKRGRNPKPGKPLRRKFSEIDTFLVLAKRAKVEKLPEPAVLMGRDIIDVVAPGPKIGKLLKKAYEIQIKKGIVDKQELKKMILLKEKK